MRFLLLLAALFLAGCCEPIVVPCPKPAEITQPVYASDTLPDSASASKKIEAIAVDLHECRDYSARLEVILKGYK